MTLHHKRIYVLLAALASVVITLANPYPAPAATAPGGPPITLWPTQCIDTMKISRDGARELLHRSNLAEVVNKEVEIIASLGANCVAVGTPYDEEFVPVLTAWVRAAHDRGLHVWFRGNFSGWESWFDYPRFASVDQHHAALRAFIAKHKDLFAAGDIFTPAPEAENGIIGNPWASESRKSTLRKFVTDSYKICTDSMERAKAKATCGYFSANGDVALNIYTPETIAKTGGVVVIDHYIKDANRMGRDIEALNKQDKAKVMVGEFGAPIPDINGDMTEAQQDQFVRLLLFNLYLHKDQIAGVNYWVLRGGTTSLINDDGSMRLVTEAIKDYFQPGEIVGTVRDGLGRPIANAVVKTGDYSQAVAADRSGHYRLVVPRSRLDVVAEAKGYISGSSNVEVTRGASVAADIIIDPEHPSLWYQVRRGIVNLWNGR